MRREMGRELKAKRVAAHISQAELARLTGKSRSMVSTLESATGGAAALGFWRRCDELFGTAGSFARRWLQIQQQVDAERAKVAAARRNKAARQTMVSNTPAHTLRALAAGQLGLAEAAAAYTGMGWPLARGQASPELVTGSVADALEVPRPAGMLAITWWLDSRGSADAIRGLPALPVPQEALAVIAAGPVLIFLARAGASPWPESAATGGLSAEPATSVIGWHAHGSTIPLPPAPAGDGGAVQWVHLPYRALRLASPFAVLGLLARAVAATRCDPDAISLADGVLAVPIRRPPRR